MTQQCTHLIKLLQTYFMQFTRHSESGKTCMTKQSVFISGKQTPNLWTCDSGTNYTPTLDVNVLAFCSSLLRNYGHNCSFESISFHIPGPALPSAFQSWRVSWPVWLEWQIVSVNYRFECKGSFHIIQCNENIKTQLLIH